MNRYVHRHICQIQQTHSPTASPSPTGPKLSYVCGVRHLISSPRPKHMRSWPSAFLGVKGPAREDRHRAASMVMGILGQGWGYSCRHILITIQKQTEDRRKKKLTHTHTCFFPKWNDSNSLHVLRIIFKRHDYPINSITNNCIVLLFFLYLLHQCWQKIYYW